MQNQVKIEAINRLKSAKGHLDHVIKMIDSNQYCIDILQQSLAVQAALRATDNIILKGHLEDHAQEAFDGDNKEKAIQEIVNIFEKSRK